MLTEDICTFVHYHCTCAGVILSQMNIAFSSYTQTTGIFDPVLCCDKKRQELTVIIQNVTKDIRKDTIRPTILLFTCVREPVLS